MPLAIPSSFDLSAYEKELNRDYEDGLLDEEELAEALNRIHGQQKVAGASVRIEPMEDETPIVAGLENFYYRELFGRSRQEEDEKLPTACLLAYVKDKPAGAVWFASEPSPDYRECLYLDMLYVLEEFRGTGAGTQLLLEMLNFKNQDDRCVITYAWKPAVDFYTMHGFLSTGFETEKEDQQFLKMILPLSGSAFKRYCREGHDPWENYEEAISLCNLPKSFLLDLTDAVSRSTPEEESDVNRNPFTVFLCKKAKLEHVLLQ